MFPAEIIHFSEIPHAELQQLSQLMTISLYYSHYYLHLLIIRLKSESLERERSFIRGVNVCRSATAVTEPFGTA